MIRRRQLLLIMGGFILVSGLALWSGRWSPPAYASVTLSKFTATSVPGHPEIVVEWETATELNTSGFFVARSDIFAGPFTQLSNFIFAEGSTIVGAQYRFTDTTTALDHTYYYRLEIVNTNQTIDYYGPISATTRSAINTPTLTPSPTATPTTQPATEVVNPTPSANSGTVVTPRVATGVTITPRPTTASSRSSTPVASAAAPTLASVTSGSLPPTAVGAAAAAVPNAANVATVVTPPPPTSAHVAQVSAKTLASTDEASALVAPVVIVTEAAPSAASINSTSSGALTLIAAAFLLLGIALLILRQARQ